MKTIFCRTELIDLGWGVDSQLTGEAMFVGIELGDGNRYMRQVGCDTRVYDEEGEPYVKHDYEGREEMELFMEHYLGREDEVIIGDDWFLASPRYGSLAYQRANQ